MAAKRIPGQTFIHSLSVGHSINMIRARRTAAETSFWRGGANGLIAVGFYWSLLEALREAPDLKLSPDSFGDVAYTMHLDLEDFDRLLNILVEAGLIWKDEDGTISNPELTANTLSYISATERRKAAAKARWQASHERRIREETENNHIYINNNTHTEQNSTEQNTIEQNTTEQKRVPTKVTVSKQALRLSRCDKYGEYVKLTPEEKANQDAKISPDETQYWIDQINAAVELGSSKSSQYKRQNHNATISQWRRMAEARGDFWDPEEKIYRNSFGNGSKPEAPKKSAVQMVLEQEATQDGN
jgi:hypothetical protein